jgi:hypothetical protein
MGEVGRWDHALFARFRKSSPGSELRRRLLNDLIRLHEPLIAVLASQLIGLTGKPLRGATRIELEDAISIGRAACIKALEQFRPIRGSFGWASYLRWKMVAELQNEVPRVSIVRVPPRRVDEQDPLVFIVADGEKLERVTRDYLPVEDEDLVEVEAPPPPPAAPPPLLDTRSTLDVFLADYCRFASHARAAAVTLRGSFESLARARGDVVLLEDLVDALRGRGVRRTTVRTTWSDGAAGYAGVALREQAPSASPATFEGLSRASLGFGTRRRT